MPRRHQPPGEGVVALSKRRVRPQVPVSVFVVSLAGPAKIVRVWPIGRAWKAVRRHDACWCRVNDDGDVTFLDRAPDAPDRAWFGILLPNDPGGISREARERQEFLDRYNPRGRYRRGANRFVSAMQRSMEPGAVSFHDQTGRR